MKTKLCFLAVLILGVVMATKASGRRSSWRSMPNIIIMLMDDMGWGDLGCYGNEAQETPNIDRLAREGAMFTDFYSPAAICSPSRAAMLTGRLPIRNGVYSNNTFGRSAVVVANGIGGLPLEEETIAESAEDFIDENKDNPFFLFWSADGTHTDLGAHRDFLGTSQRGLYGDVIRDLDHGVGQIITRLKQLKLHRNTFVFFGSDNGPARVSGLHGGSSGPFLCSKMTTYEGGMRVPGIFWWPGVIPAGQIEKAPASLLDIFQTILEISGGEVSNPERPLDGQSLWPILIDKPGATLEKDSIFYYRGTGLYAVRVGDYKAHYWTWNLGTRGKRKWGGSPCTGVFIENFITDEITDHNDQPFLFHLGRDPGELYPIDPSSEDYRTQMAIINDFRDEHLESLEGDIGYPQLNMIDRAAEEWSPPGCEEVNMCLPVPESNPTFKTWIV